MAKIILVSQFVTPTSWQLAQALKAQQHSVTVLTSYGQAPLSDIKGIEFMGFFKNWSVLEGLRILPHLFRTEPQIFHLLLEEDKLNSAQILISTFAKSLPNSVLTTSLLNIRHGLHRRNPTRYLIEASNIITCPTVEALGHLRGLNMQSTKQGRGILPPALDLKSGQAHDGIGAEEDSRFLKGLGSKPYLVIPFREPLFNPHLHSFLRIKAIAKKYKVILWGTYSSWPLRERKKFATWMNQNGSKENWMVTGELSSQNNDLLLQKSEALFLAGQHLSPIEMTEYFIRAIKNGTKLIMDSRQTSVHSELWKNSINCWVLDHHNLQRDLGQLLEKQNLKLPEAVSERLVEGQQLVDNSLNELNRLYDRALHNL